MKLFSALYGRVMYWPVQRHALRDLAGLSFPEHALIPIKPHVMLAKPARAVVLREQIGWILVMLVIVAYFILKCVNG